MTLNNCIFLTLLSVIFLLLMHLINYRREINNLKRCLDATSETLCRLQERHRICGMTILSLENRLSYLLKLRFDFEVTKSPSPLIVKDNGDKVLFEEQE